MIVYHGTTMEIQKPDIKHSKAHLDFGEGFYTTTFPKQAERWAYRKGMRLSKPAIVNVYEIGDMSGYRVRKFRGYRQGMAAVCGRLSQRERYLQGL